MSKWKRSRADFQNQTSEQTNERANEEKNGEPKEEKQKKNCLQKWHCSVKKAFPIVPLLQTYFVCVSAILHFISLGRSHSPLSPEHSTLVKHTITFEIRWWPFKHLIGRAQTNLYIDI